MKITIRIGRAGSFIGLFCVLGLFALAHPSFGQGVYGSIYGTVLDQSGAVVPNATVTIKSEQKDTGTSVQSNASGQYRIDHLVPDTYTVTITAAGFKTFAVNHLQVNVGEAPKVDANLEVGGESQTVTVSAGVEALLKTEQQTFRSPSRRRPFKSSRSPANSLTTSSSCPPVHSLL